MKNRLIWTSALLASTLGMLATGCKNNLPAPGEAPIVDGNASATDPAAVNMAAVGGPGTQVAASSLAAPQQVSAESYPQQAQGGQAAPGQAPNYGVGNSTQNEAYRYNTQQPANAYGGDPQAGAAEYDQYSALLDPNVPAAEQAPPPLPADYQQPEAPGPDYLWTPGYWDYANAGYYYVPGVWVGSPYVGALWTPGWWGYGADRYRWHHGYWGRHVGYYGGINYGFGYVGFGYQGGYWNNNHFFYNTAVLHVNPRYVNNYVYQRNITVNNRAYVNNTRVSFVGGNGGLRRAPAPQEMAALREPRTNPMQAQMAVRQEAAGNRAQFFNANNGKPAMLAAARPIAADRNVQAPLRMSSQVQAQGVANAQHPVVETRFGGAANQQQANVQQRGANLQQRDANLQQRSENLQQRGQVEQQHQQANVQQNQQLQQRNQELQQRNLQEQQRNQQQQANVQRDQQANAQRQQQMQVQNQQRAQQQANVQRQQVQVQQQHVQQQQVQQQRVQQQQMAARPAPAAAPAPHVEAPRPAPTAAAPHAAPAPAAAPHPAGGGGGGGEHHR